MSQSSSVSESGAVTFNQPGNPWPMVALAAALVLVVFLLTKKV